MPRRRKKQGRLDKPSEERSLYLLEGGTGAVLLLGRLPLSVELFYGCHCRDRMEYYRCQHQAFQDAGDWVGILFAVQAVGSVLWVVVLPQFKSSKMAYAVSLIIGGVGFALIPFLHDKYLQFIPFLMIGAGWAAMLRCLSPLSPSFAGLWTHGVLTSDSSTALSVFLRLWQPSVADMYCGW